MEATKQKATLSTAVVFPKGYFFENLAVRADNSILVTSIKTYELWYVPPTRPGEQVEPTLLYTFDKSPMSMVELEPDVFYLFTPDGYATHASDLYRIDLLRQVPGITDLRIQQPFDYPTYQVSVDRTKAAQGGYSEHDVATSLPNTLSGSFQVTPMFFLNWDNMVNYNVVAQTPQYKMDSIEDLENIPINRASGITNALMTPANPEILSDLAGVSRGHELEVVNHYNIRRAVDIYANVQDRDLGGVSSQITKILDADVKTLPRGTFVTLKGQVETMRNSYTGLLGGLIFSIVLVYLLIVVNFQSWVDPFFIITALPTALAGIVLFLFVTRTALSVPALMGAIMCMGVATANTILVVSFAKSQLQEYGDAIRAAIEAGAMRFRPVIMTALAMIIGMVPMALGLGHGGEQNAPLGRAVIGGLLCATVATLLFVPSVFALIHRREKSESAERKEHLTEEYA
jgi:multidrug efflux pump subunit AcrB